MIKAPRGTVDLLPEDTELWQHVEQTLRQISDRFNYKEIRTPLFEHTELFQRGVGDTTDIVQKEMYTFEDRGGRSITLRPEGTAPVVRAFVQNKLYGNPIQPVKLYYFGQMFRYERPQQGRMRQLNQFGVEVLGSADPAVDAEVIDLAMTCYRELGLRSLKLVINSLGDLESRGDYRHALIEHFTPYTEELCEDCQVRLRDNPMRILDCKTDQDHPAMQTAPSILDYLNEASSAYFDQVKSYLDMMGIPFEVDQNLVRGLDYYNHTAFEIMSEAEGFGAITTLTGGGRYNGLVEDLDGPETPGIGFGMGLERLIMALEADRSTIQTDDALQCLVIAAGETVDQEAVRLLHELRQAGFSADKDYMGRKMKGQFKTANRLKAQYAVIVGDEELARGSVVLRNLNTGDQEEVSVSTVTKDLERHLGGV